MTDPFDIGDPYIEWNEAISAQEPTEELEMSDTYLEDKKTEVVKLLVRDHEFLTEEAEQAVFDSVKNRPDLWHEDAEVKDLAEMLASDEDGD